MKHRRLLAWALLGTMLFSFFVTGCSSDAGGQSSAAPETQAVSTEGQTTEEATETQPATEPLTQATEAPSTEEVTETQPPAEPDAPLIGEPYLRKDLEALWGEGKLLLEGGLKDGTITDLNDYYDGVVVTGSAEQFKTGRISLDGAFRFDAGPVQRVWVAAVTQKGVDASVNVYLDDETEPAAVISMTSAEEEGDEGFVAPCGKIVLTEAITGTHKVSLGIETEAEDGRELQFFLRSLEFLQTSIPIFNIRIDESQEALDKGFGTYKQMIRSSDHSVRSTGWVDLVVPEGYSGDYTDAAQESLMDLELDYIRGRGESTWGHKKAPFRFKFEDKQDLFGMGANKNWVLLANHFDISHLRNRTAFWLGAKMGLAGTPQCIPVELMIGGDYIGLYLLCEQVRLGEGRVEIEGLKEDDTDETVISGGYLLRTCREEDEDKNNKFLTKRGAMFLNEEPEFGSDYQNDAQKKYIRDYIQKTEDAIFGEGFKDSEGHPYTDYMDLTSTVDFWWVQEFTQNQDAYCTDSTYLYKVRDGKLYWGPLWDFDYVAFVRKNPELVNSARHPWIEQLKKDEAFLSAAEARWPDLKTFSEELTKEGGVMDTWVREIQTAQIYDEEENGRGEWGLDSYEEDVEALRSWIVTRTEKIDAHMSTDFRERTVDPPSYDD